jgi:phage tail-like protein
MNTTVHQMPGQATFSPLTLTRGVHLGNNQAWRWMRRLFAAIGPSDRASLGFPAYQFRSSVTIHVLQHPVNMGNDTGVPYAEDTLASRNDPVAVSFRAYNAWPSTLAYSDLNAGDNAIMIEQMTLVHEGLDMVWDGDMGGADYNAASNIFVR